MRKYLAWFCLGFLLLTVGCQKEPAGNKAESNPAHPSFVTCGELSAVLSSCPGERTAAGGRVVSGVVPHHLLAGRLIVELMDSLVPQKPGLVVLVGPNHENNGGRIITGLYDWQTPEGVAITDQEAARALLETGLAVRDEKVLSREHSIGSLVPLIRHFLPESRILPIILHRDVSLREVEAILAALRPYLDEDAVLLASVDFSHYLPRAQAQANDEMTLEYMRKSDFTTLFRLGNDYLDSPASLACAFRLAQSRGIKEFTVLGNTNSGILMRNDVMETTSYFTLLFTEKGRSSSDN